MAPVTGLLALDVRRVEPEVAVVLANVFRS